MSDSETLGEIKQITPESDDKILEIILCLDASGSMANNPYNNPFKWEQVTKAFMDFIKDQQDKNPHSKFTMIVFNDLITVLYKNVPIGGIKCFPEHIKPYGGTRLCDVIITATRDLKKDDEKRVFVVILTDGEDTASKIKPEYARDRIKKLQEDGIEFIFLGADMDSFRAAKTYGITYAANINLNTLNSNIHNVTRHVSDTICQLVRTRSNMEDCPELVRAYTSPEYYDSEKYTLPLLPPSLLPMRRQFADAIDLYGSESIDEIPPLVPLTRSFTIVKNI
jgi:hypothetical protein